MSNLELDFLWNSSINENETSMKFKQHEKYVIDGNNIIFVPYNQTKIGIFKTSTATYNTIDIDTENVANASHFFSSAIVVGDTIYFSPYNANYIQYVTIVDNITTTNSIDISDYTDGVAKFNHIRHINNKLYFIPEDAPFIGVLDISNANSPTFSVIKNIINAISTATISNKTIITLPKSPSEYLIEANTIIGISNTAGGNWENINTTHIVESVDNTTNQITLNVDSLTYGTLTTQPTIEVTNEQYTINNITSNETYTNIIVNETLTASTSPFQIGSTVHLSGGTGWDDINGTFTIVGINYSFDIITINTTISNFGDTSDFPVIYSNNIFNKFMKCDNSVVTNNKIYMTPNSLSHTIVLDTNNESITFISHDLTSDENNNVDKYADAVLVNDKIIYTPRVLSKIGVLDTSSNTFNNITLGTVHPDNTLKYASSLIYDNKVVFVPITSGYITIFDPSTNTQEHISTEGILFSPFYQKLSPINDKLILTPSHNTMGILDLNTNTFTSNTNENINIGEYFSFSTQTYVGRYVIFTPFDSDVIGVYDTDLDTFNTIATNLTGDQKFISSIAHRSTILFSPYDADKVGYLTYSVICFLKDTFIETDQGTFRIDKLDPSRHTIKGYKIHLITKQVLNPSDTELICIEKDAIDVNVPDKLTTLTGHHKIMYNNSLVYARELIGKVDNVYRKKYNGETLYNILLEDYITFKANNMESESMHPYSRVSYLYDKNIVKNYIKNMKIKNFVNNVLHQIKNGKIENGKNRN